MECDRIWDEVKVPLTPLEPNGNLREDCCYTHTNGSFARIPMGAYKVGKIAVWLDECQTEEDSDRISPSTD